MAETWTENLINLEVPDYVDVIRTNGYAEPGDGGGATFRRVDANPGHPGSYQSADGAWWELAETRPNVRQFGAKGDGVADDQPAFQAAVDAFDVVYVPAGTYNLASTTTRDVMAATSDTAGALVPATWAAPIWLTGSKSLIGEPGAKLECKISGVKTIIGLLDWEYAEVSGLEIEGRGATGNAAHGILNAMTGTEWLARQVRLDRLKVGHVGSYGIGWQFGHLFDAKWTNLYIHDTGADGFDHKIRYGTRDRIEDGTWGVVMDNIHVHNHGQRVAGTSGIDIRGSVQASNIVVTGIGASNHHLNGITMSAGLWRDDGSTETRQAARGSSLTNWRVEAKDPTYETIGLHVLESGSVTIGPGSTKWCRTGVRVRRGGTTPYRWVTGPTLTGVIVEGARENGNGGFLVDLPGTSLIGCKTLSDVQYFNEERGTLEENQTQLLPVGGVNPGSAGFTVVKNGTELTLTTDYTVLPGNVGVELVTPAQEGDEFLVINKTLRGVRIEGPDVTIVGHYCDDWCNTSISFAETIYRTSSTVLANRGADARLGIRDISGIAELYAAGPAENIDLRLTPKGTGRVRIGTYVDTPGSITGYIEVRDASGNVRKLAVIS